MRFRSSLQLRLLPLLIVGVAFLSETQARRLRVQPRLLAQEDAEENLQYYAAEPQQEAADNRQRVVLISSDDYNGLYGQQTPAASRGAQDNYIPRSSAKDRQYVAQRVKDTPREPPVQTIRNYNKVNDDGSFTFGYEAADGSFKEETRGTDCVVRGKYGYVDPDGNKREFTYVSGNPCDPNAPKEEDEESSSENESNENIPQNYPTRPIRPIARPVASTIAPKPVTTLFQTQYEREEEEQPEPEQLLRPTPSPVRSRPQYIARPQYVQQQQVRQPEPQIQYQRPQPVQSSTPVSTLYRHQAQPITITPRPVQSASPTTATRTQLPATTFRPQLQVAVTPRPALLYTPKSVSPSPAPSRPVDFDAEFQRFQQENNILAPTPSIPGKGPTPRPEPVGQIYSSALVFDPSTGQYRNQLYQSLPQSEGDFAFNQRIQPYVHTQQQQQRQQPQQPRKPTVSLEQYQPQAPLYRQQVQQINPQAIYQQQQAERQFQNSAQLYAQQQQVRQQQSTVAQRPPAQRQYAQPSTAAPPVYYIQPSVDTTGALGAGQIDAFLRGHNIQF